MKKLILSLFIALCSFFVQAQTADALFEQKDYVKAVEAYKQELKTEPNNVVKLRRIAFCYTNIQNTDHLAEYYFEQALKVDPKDMASNYYVGMSYKKTLSKDISQEQKNINKQKAKAHLQAAAAAGSLEAKQELIGL